YPSLEIVHEDHRGRRHRSPDVLARRHASDLRHQRRAARIDGSRDAARGSRGYEQEELSARGGAVEGIMRIRIGILAAGLLGLGAVPAAACSCRCADAATLAREVPLFFRGTPVAETVDGAKRRYVFEVSAVHKGTTAARTVVGTPVHAAACGVRFPLNQEALVGAFPAEGEVH